jgi:hypothetical protein
MKARSLLPLFAAVALLFAQATAHAQADQQQTIDKIVQLNRDGVAQYQKKKFEAARKLLKQAMDLCEANGLDRHPVAARTHVHLGIVIIGGFGQREIGGKQFATALQIQPDITLTPGVASPAIQDVFNEALVAVRAPAPAPAAAATEAPPAEAPAAESATVTQVEDDKENPLTAQPAAAEPARAPAPASDEPPVATARRAPEPVKKDDDDDDDDGGDTGETMPRSRIQLTALLGTGVGYATGTADVNAGVPVSGSFSGAKLGHLAAEAGYWMSPRLMLSLQGRFQIVSGPTVIEHNGHTYQPASGATAMFAAATYMAGPLVPHLRPFVSGSVGGGRIRHVVTLPQYRDCGANHNETCVDTVGGGLFLAGVGGGLNYALSDGLGLVAAINTQLGAPDFTFNVDFNVGVAVHL